MIIVNLIGGLGNQMFQYACGWALGRDSGSTVKVATDMFYGYSRHNGPELDRVFSTPFSVAGRRDLEEPAGTLARAAGGSKMVGARRAEAVARAPLYRGAPISTPS